MLIDGLELCWLLVDYNSVFFFSAVWTLILTAPIHCRGSIGEQMMWCYISPNLFWWRIKLIYILDCLMVSTFSEHFQLWVNYSFKCFLKRQLSCVNTVEFCTWRIKSKIKAKHEDVAVHWNIKEVCEWNPSLVARILWWQCANPVADWQRNGGSVCRTTRVLQVNKLEDEKQRC